MSEIRFRSLLLIFGWFSFLFFGFNQSSDASEAITNSLGMKFVYIEPGTFMIGSPESEPGRYSDELQHRATLTRGYYMQTTEVTQGQWKAVMGNNPSRFSNCGDNCPVENVSWYDVQEFIQKLNQLEGTNVYRLPTEAQWEYAARSGSTTAFANGSITETGCGYDPHLDRMGWYCGNSEVAYKGASDGARWGEPKNSGTHPVAQKASNDWGLYDMHGNVLEWVSDWYGNYPSPTTVDPTGPKSGFKKVLRGGSWANDAYYAESSFRTMAYYGTREFHVGFRIVLLTKN